MKPDPMQNKSTQHISHINSSAKTLLSLNSRASDEMTNRKTNKISSELNSGIGDDLISQFRRNEDDVTVAEAEPINIEELPIVPIEPEPEDQAINQLLLDIDDQQKQGPDDLPSGLTWASLGFAILDVPLLREEPIGPSLPPSAASSDSGELPIQDLEDPQAIHHQLVLDQQKEEADDLPSGLSLANLGFAIIDVPLFRQEPIASSDSGEMPIQDPQAIQQLVTEVLARADLESSNLVVVVDFTKRNVWTATIHDQDDCNGFVEVLTRYKEIVPHLQLAGLTSFAPIIEMAKTIVEQSGGQCHVLFKIADGQSFPWILNGGEANPMD